MEMQTKAKLSNLRIAPRKVRLVVDSVRGTNIAKARTILSASKKHAARPVLKLIESAVANAKHNHSALEDTLVISEAFVDQGKTLHRWMPRAMGRATPLRMRASHVTVILKGDSTKNDAQPKKVVATEVVEKEEDKKTVTKKKSVKKVTTKKATTKKSPSTKKKVAKKVAKVETK
jgi:large subunit ribosomal protein L22